MIERSGHTGISEIRMAFHADAALRVIEEWVPDIIITDIRMPDISGLEFIQRVKQMYPSVRFVALSGYDDFRYVKEAFKLGVADYLLKPAAMDELMAVLNKVMEGIQEEQQIRIHQQSSTHKYLQMVLENQLNKALTGSHLPEGGIKALFEEMNISFSYSCFAIGMIALSNSSPDSIINEKLTQCFDSIGKKFVNLHPIVIFHFQGISNHIVVLFNHKEDIIQGLLTRYLSALMEDIKTNAEVECSAALSETGVGIEHITQCYEQAGKALAYRVVYGPFYVVHYEEVKGRQSRSELLDKHVMKLKEYIGNYQAAESSNIIDEIFHRDSLKNISIEGIQRLYRNVVNIAGDAITADNMGKYHERYEDFEKFSLLSDVKIYLKTVVFDAVAQLKEKNRELSVVDIVKRYVRENYYKDIDMAVVANLVSVSYSHFSKIFKEETGMNFSDYLIKVRMEKALEMLNNPVNRVQDIAASVGYGNPKHFTRAFKNYFGFAPTDYRDHL